MRPSPAPPGSTAGRRFVDSIHACGVGGNRARRSRRSPPPDAAPPRVAEMCRLTRWSPLAITPPTGTWSPAAAAPGPEARPPRGTRTCTPARSGAGRLPGGSHRRRTTPRSRRTSRTPERAFFSFSRAFAFFFPAPPVSASLSAMMKCGLYASRNAAKHQNASLSSTTFSRNRAATSFMPWQYPTFGSRSAYATRARVKRALCAACHVGTFLFSLVSVSVSLAPLVSRSASRSRRQCVSNAPPG